MSTEVDTALPTDVGDGIDTGEQSEPIVGAEVGAQHDVDGAPIPDGAVVVPEDDKETKRTGRVHFPALDGARAIGAYMVILTHVGFRTGQSLDGSLFANVLSRFNYGVTLFFVLSGFLLYRPFAAHALGEGPKVAVRGYFRRRAARIIPALWVFILVVLIFLAKPAAVTRDFYSYLTLIQVYNHNDARPELTHLWSLSAEVAFYVLLPVLAWTFARPTGDRNRSYRRQLIGVAVVMALAYAFAVVRGMDVIHHIQAALWLPNFLPWFCTGMLLAVISLGDRTIKVATRLRRTLKLWSSSLITCWFVAVALFMMATLPIGTPYDLKVPTSSQFITQNVLFGLSAFFLVCPLVLFRHRHVEKALGAGIGKYLGDISYSVYLWHVPCMMLVEKWLGYEIFSGHFWQILGLTALMATAVASLSWFVIEKPALRYFSGRRKRKAAAQQKATAQ